MIQLCAHTHMYTVTFASISMYMCKYIGNIYYSIADACVHVCVYLLCCKSLKTPCTLSLSTLPIMVITRFQN